MSGSGQLETLQLLLQHFLLLRVPAAAAKQTSWTLRGLEITAWTWMTSSLRLWRWTTL
jgi:hypothetical protein